MTRLIKPIIWTLVFLALMLAVDQFLVQVPPAHPAHAAISRFYLDFRNRMIDILFGEKKVSPASIEAVIEGKQGPRQQAGALPTAKGQEHGKAAAELSSKPKKRYIYSDANGELQFADSLEEVPKKYRGQAQPMAE